ncbi:EscU/YscU/HrcU family type III secretion system export apparatus switch protein [Sutcliffiella cohnii]
MKKEEINNRKKAVALKYENSMAPFVSAKGSGIIAENIINAAKEHNIPIQEDKALVELLAQLEVNDTIPEELYEVVAEVFAFVYRLNNAKEKNKL